MSEYSSVAFNSVGIESLVEGLKILSVDAFRPLERTNTQSRLARSNLSKLLSSYYYNRKIVVRATIGSDTGKPGMEAMMDTLQAALQGQEKVLAVSQAGAIRNYTATLSGITVNEYFGGYAEIDIVFICSDPFGYDANDTTLLNTARTTASFTAALTASVLGSFAASPVITVTLGTISGGTSKYIQITNPASGKYIKVTSTWANSDVLIIDCLNKTVKVNGTNVDFVGNFPDYDLGAGSMTYEDTLTTRSVTLNVVYKKRYL